MRPEPSGPGRGVADTAGEAIWVQTPEDLPGHLTEVILEVVDQRCCGCWAENKYKGKEWVLGSLTGPLQHLITAEFHKNEDESVAKEEEQEKQRGLTTGRGVGQAPGAS